MSISDFCHINHKNNYAARSRDVREVNPRVTRAEHRRKFQRDTRQEIIDFSSLTLTIYKAP